MKKKVLIGLAFIFLFILGANLFIYMIGIIKSYEHYPFHDLELTVTVNRKASSSPASLVLENIENSSIEDFIGNDTYKSWDNLSYFMNNDTLNAFLALAHKWERGDIKFEWNVSAVRTKSSLSYLNSTTFHFLCETVDTYFYGDDYIGWWMNGTLHSFGSVASGGYTAFQKISIPFYWIYRGKFYYSAVLGPLHGYFEEVNQLFLFNHDLDPVCLAYKHISAVA